MARLPSLNHQMFQRLEEKKAIGESRHLAKLKAKNQFKKVETIHSYKTYDAYKQSSKTFIKWLKQKFPEIKDINDITKDIGAMYVKYRAEQGVSPYTYSQDIAMLNKTGFLHHIRAAYLKKDSLMNIATSGTGTIEASHPAFLINASIYPA